MGALPRPATPGPWYAAETLDAPVVMTKERATLVCSVHPYAASFDLWGADDDTLAIAALPERIAREDRVREFCEHLITGAAAHPDDDHSYVEAAVARQVLRLLDGEEA